MRRISKVIILTIIVLLLSSCGKKSYVVFDYNCNGQDYHKCELKNNKLNCNVETPTCGEYTFKGWFRANEYNNQVDLNGTFNKNEIIYARWEKESGIIESSSRVEPTSTIVTPGIIDIPSSSSETPSSSQQQVTPPTPVDPPKPEETYTISFNLNGGTGGQTTSISGVKYNNDLPSINQNKPVKPGYTFMGWYDSQNGGTQYYNSSNSPVRKYDKRGNITLYAQWKINTLSIQYNGNGGSWNSSNSTYGVNSSNTVIVKSTNKVYQKVLNYGAKLNSSGLTDYNGSWFKWTRSGYIVESKKEYKIGSTVLDQAKVYSAVELSRYGGCDLSKTDCTITVKVNWKLGRYSAVNYNNFKWTSYNVNSGPAKKYMKSNINSYGIFAPDNVKDLNGVSLPLIIIFHGAGEFIGEPGQNNYLNVGIPSVIRDWKNSKLKPIPAIIVAPHGSDGWWAGHITNENTVRALVSYVKDYYNIDTSKIVYFGHSSGGFGAIEMSWALKKEIPTFKIVTMSSQQQYYKKGKGGEEYYSNIPIRGYGEIKQQQKLFDWIGQPQNFTYYSDYSFPEDHMKVPERALHEDKNNDKVSDLIYWLFGDDANTQ